MLLVSLQASLAAPPVSHAQVASLWRPHRAAAALPAREAPTQLAMAALLVICAMWVLLQASWAAPSVRLVLRAALSLLLVAAAALRVEEAPTWLAMAVLPVISAGLVLLQGG